MPSPASPITPESLLIVNFAVCGAEPPPEPPELPPPPPLGSGEVSIVKLEFLESEASRVLFAYKLKT